MRLSTVAFCAVALLSGADAFAPAMPAQSRGAALVPLAAEATMADSGVPAETATPSDSVEDAEIPTVLPSDVGMDYVPLATMLATGQLAEADQVRLICIFIDGRSGLYKLKTFECTRVFCSPIRHVDKSKYCLNPDPFQLLSENSC